MAILTRHVDIKGRRAVVLELGISSTTLSQVLAGKYGASTTAIEERIMKIYGNDGFVNCPVLGKIRPDKCAENHKRAKTGVKPGNPLTIRLYVRCRKCDFRN